MPKSSTDIQKCKYCKHQKKKHSIQCDLVNFKCYCYDRMVMTNKYYVGKKLPQFKESNFKRLT